MWLILLLIQIQVRTQQDVIQVVPELDQKGPNYRDRIQSLDYHINKNCDTWQGYLQSRANDFLVDSTIFFSPAIEQQAWPQATFDGTNYFVIWSDDRRTTANDNKRDVYGTRVSADGQVLDVNGIFIGTTNSFGNTYIGMFPAVAYGAGVYFCVWEDFDWDNWTWDLWGVRVDTSGNVLDYDRIQITNRQSYEGMAQVSFDGTNFLVVWDDYDGSIPDDDIYGARVTPQGVVLDPSGFAIHSNISYKSIYTDVEFDGTNYMVVWTDERTPSWSIYFARVTPQGVVLDPTGYPICDLEAANAYMPRITYGAGNYFVGWDDCRDPCGPPYGARVTPQGVVLNPDGFRLAPTSTYYFGFPSVTFDGVDYFVAYADQSWGCFGARISPSGALIDTMPITMQSPYDAFTTDVISNGINSFAVWSEDKYSDWDIFGARVNQNGNVLDPNGFIVSSSVDAQDISAVASDSQNYFVVWEDKHNTFDIYDRFVSPTTGPVGSALQISARSWDEGSPSVAFGDSNYLAVWNGNFSTWDIFGARVSPTGQVLDPSGIAIGAWSGNQGYPSVAYGNSNWLVVWDDNRSGVEDIYGARVNPQGQLLDPSHILISGAGSEQWLPCVAFDGTNYLVTWTDRRNTNFDVYCTRLDTAGNVLDPNGIIVSGAASDQYAPKAVFDGTYYFIVWMDWRNNGTTEWDIFGARVAANGTVLDPSGIPICTAPYDQGMPGVTFDGANYIVLWEDARSAETWDIYGAMVNTSGAVVDTFIVANDRITECSPALSKGPSFEQALFSYTKQAPGPYDVLRIYGQYYPPVGIEEFKIASPRTPNLRVLPNPFGNFTRINYTVPNRTEISLKLYSAEGRMVNTLTDGIKEAGTYSLQYEGKELASGIYFLDLKIGGSHKTLKVVKLGSF